MQKSYHTKTADFISQFIQTKVACGFTAGELSAFLKEHGVTVNKTTVYRQLEKMTESGSLVKHKSPVSEGFVYESAGGENHCAEHIHFQCCSCGSVIHLSDVKTAEYLRSLSDTLGLQINMSLSSLNGICRKCSGRAEQESGVSSL